MDLIGSVHLVKDMMSQVLGISHQTLHIHAGLAIYLSVQLALGTRRSSSVALLAVAVAEFLNECLDWIFHGRLLVADTAGDIVATLAWPMIFYAVGAIRREQWRRDAARRKKIAEMMARLTNGPQGSARPQRLTLG
jgi:hypothetical protein